MGLTGSSADAVIQLFSAPARVLGTTSVFSAVVLCVAGVSFAGSVQGGFERIWGLPAGPWHKIWRQAVWVAGLIGYIYADATIGTVTHAGPAVLAGRVLVAVVLGIAFFWWGLRFLLGGRVSYLAAMPGAVATLVGLAGLRVFSGLVFEPLIIRNAVSYGALGTVLIVQSWRDRGRLGPLRRPAVLGAGSTTPGCQDWAQSRWGYEKPEGGEGRAAGATRSLKEGRKAPNPGRRGSRARALAGEGGGAADLVGGDAHAGVGSNWRAACSAVTSAPVMTGFPAARAARIRGVSAGKATTSKTARAASICLRTRGRRRRRRSCRAGSR